MIEHNAKWLRIAFIAGAITDGVVTPGPRDGIDWTRGLRRYLIASIVIHLVWEILQLPLYTLWTTGTRPQQTFAVLHCTIGDAMIAGLSLLTALALFASVGWPSAGAARVSVATLACGIGYTIFSEWLNTSVRGSWTYSEFMPVVPVIGTGLAPLLQWFLVPSLALWIAMGRMPRRRPGKWPQQTDASSESAVAGGTPDRKPPATTASRTRKQGHR